ACERGPTRSGRRRERLFRAARALRAATLAAVRARGASRGHVGARRLLRGDDLPGLRRPHVPQPHGRARAADLQRQRRRPLLRARGVRRDRRVLLRAADDPEGPEDLPVPDDAPLALVVDLPGAVVAAIFAPPIARLTGVGAGIATLALLVIDNVFNVQTTSITRGTSTLIGVP